MIRFIMIFLMAVTPLTASALTKSGGVTKVSTSDVTDTDDVWDPKPPKVGAADVNDTDD